MNPNQPTMPRRANLWRSAALALLSTALVAHAADQPAVDPAVTAAMEKVNASGASLMPVAAESADYRFTALNVAKTFTDAGLAPLAPIAGKIASIDLARTKVTDAGLAALSGMTGLKELHLENTAITDAGLDHLKGLAALEYLNLYGTKVTDAGIQKLAGLGKLKALYLWQTGVTKAGVAQLRGKLAAAHINIGWNAEDDAKPAAAAAAPAVAAAAKKPAAAPAAAAPAAKFDLAALGGTVVFKDVVMPILEAKCTGCHGAEKSKGKLRMDTLANLLKGGGDGPTTLVPGKSADSLMMKRILLPKDDDDHMPPAEKDQITTQECQLLAWWINEGGSETMTIAQAKNRAPNIEAALAVVLASKKAAAPVAAAKPAAPAPAPAKPAAPAAAPAKAPALNPEIAAKADVYQHIIAPILEAKCTSCHGAEKSKGKLRMHTFADIMKGGGDGPTTVVAGKSKDSLMMQRILLAKDDDDHMPPADEPQITTEECQVLSWWIGEGAPEKITVAAVKKPANIEAILASMLANGLPKVTASAKPEKPKLPPLTEAEKKAVADVTLKLQGLNASLMPLAQDTEQLRLSVINAADKFGDAELKLLEPIAKQVVWIDLARSQITDASGDTLAKFANLERLHLENTKIGDGCVSKLGALTKLEYINLYGTKTTDAGLAKLAGAKALQKVFVWQTGVTQNGAKALKGQIPAVTVNIGLSEAEIAALTAPPPPPPAPAKAPEKKDAAKPAVKPAATPAAKPAATPAAKPAATPAAKPATPAATPKPATTPPAPAAKPAAPAQPKAQ
ncbi:MAG: hypothetical protein H7A55_07830 [Verrucomicrobiaceae bacterium]|nr:hypothetical protein [Verrucomicrobiaceae bacterium]